MKQYDNYKNSGVEWLGEIPEHWEVKKMKFIGNIYAGINGKKGDDFSKEYSDGIKSFIPFTNICNNIKIDDNQYQYVKISENENQNRVKKNDILFLMSSETLDDIAKNSIYLGENTELYLNSFCKGFRISKHNVNAEFVNYLFLSTTYRNYFSLVGRGFTRINLKQEFINDAYALLPKLKEQTAIANFLDNKTTKIDQAIAIKQQQIELLKERRQILIHKAVTRGLNENVKLKDSGVEWIGEIPEHWELSPLRHIGKTQNGISKGGESFGTGYPFVSYGDVYKDIQLPETIYGLVESTNEDRIQYSVLEGDILFTRTSETVEEIGFSSTCLKTIENATFAGFLIRFRPKKNKLNKEFSKYYFSSSTHRAFFIKEMNLVIRASLSQDLLKRMPVLLPPFPEQEEIGKYLNNTTIKIATAISLKEQEIEKLKEYKMSLIDGVVTGKVRVIS